MPCDLLSSVGVGKSVCFNPKTVHNQTQISGKSQIPFLYPCNMVELKTIVLL